MAGHSHWANIKRKKGRNDAKRGKIWSKIAKKIIVAAKSGPNPADNLSLRYIMEEARAANMPKATIENAVAKGSGAGGGDNYEAVLFEGYGPNGVAFLVETLTDNRNRTVPELRLIFDRAGGSLATSGSVAFQFATQGQIAVKAEGVDEDAVMEAALEAGAEDVANEGEVFLITTAAADLHSVKTSLEESGGYTIESAEIANVAQNTVAVEGDAASSIVKLIDALEDNDDVQSVSHNADLPEDAFAG